MSSIKLGKSRKKSSAEVVEESIEQQKYTEISLLPANIDEHTLRDAQIRAREYGKLMEYYKCAIMEVETKFNVLNEEFSLLKDRTPIVTIKSRLKKPASVREKLLKHSCPVTVDAIDRYVNDIAGVRVICSFPEDVYLLADAFLRQDDVFLIRKKDYIAHPKPNGYRSLHLIIETPIFLLNTKKMMKVEIQLRTIAMDCWATLEHQINYKKDFETSPELQNELRECADLSAELDARMDALRERLLGDSAAQEEFPVFI